MITNSLKPCSSFVRNICTRSVENVGFQYFKKQGVIDKYIGGVANDCIEVSFKNNFSIIKNKTLFSLIDKALFNTNKNEWFKDETISLLSSEVNRVIDVACDKYNFSINKEERGRIFNKISSGLGVIKLDPVCTQSSIMNILNNNKYISNKIECLYDKNQSSNEKNNLKNIVNHKLTDIVFMRKFGGIDMDTLRRNVADEISLIIRLKK
ncbi:hypothetical protein JFY74_21080 [Pectobacterium carotovorum]|nr:hypothetical protein JFY74_21080 [Pectobacterium carotovorum]